MFRNRRTSQKPSDDLYKSFKANFPGLGQTAATTTTSTTGANAESGVAATHDGLDDSKNDSDEQHNATTDLKDSDDPTPRPHNDQWNFSSGLTPSLMDPNSHAFNMFANQMPGYYTPTPGGTNTLYHSQAGDLHTPNLGAAALNTPLSLPTTDSILHAGHQNAYQMQPHMSQHFQQQFHSLNPFQTHHQQHTSHHMQHQQHQQHPHQQQQQTFAPHQFSHQPSYDHIDTMDGSPIGDLSLDVDMQHSQNASPELLMHPHSFAKPAPPIPSSTVRSQHPTGDKSVVKWSDVDEYVLTTDDRFRWHATLNAPTAMIKHSDEIPITYLNKGQAYTLNVVDTHAQQRSGPLKYRTFVRISFEDEQQRLRPSACWQLWKEGRGTNEAHQRGGRLQAVEYVAANASNANDPLKPHMELECASFDGFCVQWTPAAGSSECPISVRFNFLSTDFSHSKGVKGIPVRLCAKTQVIGQDQALSEVCYCKVKLFRDHGAERKLSNDVAHVKKSIDKLSSQIQQLENGLRDGNGKRKRSGSVVKGGIDSGRPGKIPRHRRTWSMSSVTSSSARAGAEEDLHMKLMSLNDMFTSTRPASVLYLRGAEEDDPDLAPVKLTGETVPATDLKRNDSGETSTSWEQQSNNGPSSSLVSPSPSNHSLVGSRRDSTLQQPTPFGGPSRVNSNDWRPQPQTAIADIPIQQLATPLESQPIKVQTRSPTAGTMSGWVEAIGVDHSYQPPADDRVIKPVACFYVQPRVTGKPTTDNFHRAVYLTSRSLREFVKGVASKSDIEPSKVIRTYRVSRSGLQILFDDECIRELPEGQDMTAEFSEISNTQQKPGREWDVADIQVDGGLATLENVQTSGYELKLLY